MRKTSYIYLFIIAVFLFLPANAIAQEKNKAPTLKEQFLTAWEIHQKSLPTTVTLEKTDATGIYNYETTLFPYKGTLKINNIVISKDLEDYYYDYDLGVQNVLKGVIEVELPDLPKDTIYKSYPHSYRLWEKENYLLYDEEAQTWMSTKQWRTAKSIDANTAQNAPSQYSHQCFNKLIAGFAPLILFLLFLILILWLARKQQKEQIVKFDLSIERQLESIEIQKQSLELQKEQTEILRRLDANK